jgi:hypothetical protein
MKNFTKLGALLLVLLGAFLCFGCSSGDDDNGGSTVAVTGVSLSIDNPNIVQGNSRQLSWIVSPVDATNTTVTFKSSNTAAATVDGKGVVSAKAAGTTVITITTNDGSKTATVNVTVAAAEIPVTSLVIPATASVYVGESKALSLTITPTGATSDITWKSSNEAAATVKGGVVTGVAEGIATITVTSGNVSDNCTLTVTIPEKKLTVTEFPNTASGKMYQLLLSETALSNDELVKYLTGEKALDIFAGGSLDGTSIDEATLREKSGNLWKGDGDYYIYIVIMDLDGGFFRSKGKITFAPSTTVKELKFTDFQAIKVNFPDDGDDGDGADDDYTLVWGSFSSSYADVQSTIKAQGWNVQQAGSTAGIATGATATTIYQWCFSNAAQIGYTDSGSPSGPFETLVNTSNQGISAPDALKTALRNNKANVPLAGIFDAQGQAAVVFYITKN